MSDNTLKTPEEIKAYMYEILRSLNKYPIDRDSLGNTILVLMAPYDDHLMQKIRMACSSMKLVTPHEIKLTQKGVQASDILHKNDIGRICIIIKPHLNTMNVPYCLGNLNQRTNKLWNKCSTIMVGVSSNFYQNGNFSYDITDHLCEHAIDDTLYFSNDQSLIDAIRSLNINLSPCN